MSRDRRNYEGNSIFQNVDNEVNDIETTPSENVDFPHFSQNSTSIYDELDSSFNNFLSGVDGIDSKLNESVIVSTSNMFPNSSDSVQNSNKVYDSVHDDGGSVSKPVSDSNHDDDKSVLKPEDESKPSETMHISEIVTHLPNIETTTVENEKVISSKENKFNLSRFATKLNEFLRTKKLRILNSTQKPSITNIKIPEKEAARNESRGYSREITRKSASILRYTTAVTPSTTFSTKLDKKKTSVSQSVCFNDPCGKNIACLPKGNNFTCVCSDGTELSSVGELCPSDREVNLTPPAQQVPKSDIFLLPSHNVLLGAAIGMGLIVCILLSLVYWKRKKILFLLRQKNAPKITTITESLKSYNFANNPNYYISSPQEKHPLQTLSVKLISKEQIDFLGEIGEGCFGRVFKGMYVSNEERGSAFSLASVHSGRSESSERSRKPKGRMVAVKILKEALGPEAEADFMREVEIMSTFKHPNILNLIGVVPSETSSTPWMVFEYMPYGDLAEVVRSCNKLYSKDYITSTPLTNDDLLNICVQVARGMEYLSIHHFVHRDLASRNCLVGANLTVKISDFGMSRDVYTCDYYKVGGSRMLPIRWMAPESILYGKFTLESDVWSFGIVLWEIFTLGKQPYYGHSNEDVVQLILQGTQLSSPDPCPDFVKEIMKLCWIQEPHDRINFSQSVQKFEEGIKKEREKRASEEEMRYSQLCLHDTFYKDNFEMDSDAYLLPNTRKPAPEYLIVTSEV